MSFLVAFIRNTFSDSGGSIQLPSGGYGRAYGQHYGN